MVSLWDKANRPIIVATGIGVVTSLGLGKTESWERYPPASPKYHRADVRG
jgi:hypothetical protein